MIETFSQRVEAANVLGNILARPPILLASWSIPELWPRTTWHSSAHSVGHLTVVLGAVIINEANTSEVVACETRMRGYVGDSGISIETMSARNRRDPEVLHVVAAGSDFSVYVSYGHIVPAALMGPYDVSPSGKARYAHQLPKLCARVWGWQCLKLDEVRAVEEFLGSGARL